jgi:hypothetical protein
MDHVDLQWVMCGMLFPFSLRLCAPIARGPNHVCARVRYDAMRRPHGADTTCMAQLRVASRKGLPDEASHRRLVAVYSRHVWLPSHAPHHA